MEYTQQQVRQVIGVGQQTFRYWKNLLPPLAARSGKSAHFSTGEMLALAIVNLLVRAYKMDISAILPVAEKLFDVCGRPLLFSRHSTVLWIDLQAPSLVLANDLNDLPIDRTYLVVPISRLWQELSKGLMQTERLGEQQELLPLALVN